MTITRSFLPICLLALAWTIAALHFELALADGRYFSVALGDLEAKLRAFGWYVRSCDGHDHAELREVFADFRGSIQALVLAP